MTVSVSTAATQVVTRDGIAGDPLQWLRRRRESLRLIFDYRDNQEQVGGAPMSTSETKSQRLTPTAPET